MFSGSLLSVMDPRSLVTYIRRAFLDFSSKGMNCSERTAAPKVLVSNTSRKSLMNGLVGGAIPALLIKTSRRPKILATVSTNSAIDSWFVTSRGSMEKLLFGNFFSRSCRALSPRSRFRLVIMMWQSGEEAARPSAVW